jgi:hypothetical protein
MLLSVIFAVICISALSFIDGRSGGYALAFVSFTLALSCVAVAALFFHHAKVMDSILNTTQLLAHWEYSPEETERSARLEYSEYKERNRALFFIIGGMLVISALVMIIFAGDGGLITGIFLLAFTVLLFIVSRVAPVLVLKGALKASGEAYIAENGIIYEGAIYPFRTFLMKMGSVKFKSGQGRKPSLLIFSFTQLIGLYILSQFDIEIPVPEGKEEAARQIADKLGRVSIENKILQ